MKANKLSSFFFLIHRLIKFCSTETEPCTSLAPWWDELKTDMMEQHQVFLADVDAKETALFERFSIAKTPTFILLRNRKVRFADLLSSNVIHLVNRCVKERLVR